MRGLQCTARDRKRRAPGEVRKISKKEKNGDGEWMYLTEWEFYDDITWETSAADTLRAGAKDVLNDFNKKY